MSLLGQIVLILYQCDFYHLHAISQEETEILGLIQLIKLLKPWL